MRVVALCALLVLPLGACGGDGGSDGTGGSGGGGSGGGGTAAPAGCTNLSIKTTADAIDKLVVPTCGKGPTGQICHAGTFPPRLDVASMVKTQLIDKKGVTTCMSDLYINSKDPAKSYMLAKINASGGDPLTNAKCPSGGGGGGQMPYKGYSPPAPDLTADQKACLTWFVTELAAGH
jgi:hypothetical protein